MRTTQLCVLLAALALLSTVHADVYMHMMRGSNNRLKAEGENTENQNRLFNSQNNAKGGYNVGADQPEEYYVGSEMLLEWTAQHGCNNPNDECEIIIQYMCNDQNNHYYRNGNIRDGTTEETPPEDNDGGAAFGQHEPNKYYKDCKARQRNEGLVTLDRRRFYGKEFYNAQYTRQNENGNRRGYECQEERDYYPYWHPTPWRDVAILIDDWRFSKFCPFYETATENLVGRGYCTNPVHNNQQACTEGRFYYPQDQAQLDRERELQRQVANVAFWTLRLQQTPGDQGAQQQLQQAQQQVSQITGEVKGYHDQRKGTWQTSSPLDAENKHPLRCRPLHPGSPNASSRDNHLGNTGSGQPASFLWKIPDTPADACTLRLRYNMSSTDYPAWRTWSEHNGDKSPIFQEMEVPVGTFGKVRLAINTNQIGRTFQDRSHTFKIKRRDGNLAGARIINFNVRGKRGNIVQAYPAVEYDYHPNRAQICAGDYVHFQWTGSNTNPRNYAGQGTAGTDRHNIVQMGKKVADGYNWKADNFQMNRPLPIEQVDMFDTFTNANEKANAIKKFALLGQTDDLLNDASSYFNFPPIQYNTAGKTYHFMCTRNNNFSNRSQKGFINVNDCASRDPSKLPELQPGAVMEDTDDSETRYDNFSKKYAHGF